MGEFENSASSYGTFDQGGNVWERCETLNGSTGIVRGGSFDLDAVALSSSGRENIDGWNAGNDYGFRIASNVIPEPTMLLLLGLGGLLIRKRK